ncbi:hypothetical protein Echvi_0368 [Echinicola vietnamensis DSM 17526]|uniref:Uncharacterized protein n=1 Tax=Echinicola vietnamensis (strain DSM 17526 / LMG 23754 / KMM 6221) TaxID=926556 RepID=L0FUF7_ECHVK|nr:hypothetical protein Echvi_0368 [Echinicola vietnamensis DSM 17526]
MEQFLFLLDSCFYSIGALIDHFIPMGYIIETFT